MIIEMYKREKRKNSFLRLTRPNYSQFIIKNLWVLNECMNKCMNKQMNDWMIEWINEWMNERMNEWMNELIDA